MRVLYSFPHAIGRTGIGVTAAAQVQGVVDRGVEVSLYCASVGSEIRGVARTIETMVLANVRVPHRTVGVDRAYRYHDWRVARALSARPDEFDLVHCWPLGSARTLEAARRAGVKSLREVPNSHTGAAYARAAAEAEVVGVELRRGQSHAPNPRRLVREETEYRLADTLLVPSDHVKQTFLDRGFPPEKLARHRYGFNPDRFPPPASNEERVSDAPLIVLFVGNGEPRKGLHYALQAWIHSGVAERGRFIVCGHILPAYRAFLAPYLAHPSVVVRGFVNDVGALMRQSDVFVLPSVEEGSALVTYEAQASGCVLAVSDAAGAICHHLDQGLIHRAGDVEMLSDHIRLLDEDRALLRRLRDSTLACREDLTWSTAANTLVDIYAQCFRVSPAA